MRLDSRIPPQLHCASFTRSSIASVTGNSIQIINDQYPPSRYKFKPQRFTVLQFLKYKNLTSHLTWKLQKTSDKKKRKKYGKSYMHLVLTPVRNNRSTMHAYVRTAREFRSGISERLDWIQGQQTSDWRLASEFLPFIANDTECPTRP